MTILLATKLHQPSPPPQRVPRPHLSQRLHQGLEAGRQITLVSAPAGFGKTTCVSAWLDTLESWPVAWLSLDPSDDDPGRFFAYFVAALQKVDQNLGREIKDVLRAGQLPPGEIISATLINDILEAGDRFLLVLDDFQVIQDRFILQVLEKLVANLPQPLHLVLLTREDPSLPLARLRANNQLTEIRARDLRFSERDAARFLNEVMGLDLSPADIATLEERTEGWIVGLQLAGLSIRDRADSSHFIATLSGSHRFILGYLTEQVLSQQPREVQDFLLQTSILGRLNGDLCDAVTGRADSHALLERLFNANLFLIPLDDEQQWYRYHHLFADLLRDLQNARQEDQTTELHQRASQWYAQAGDARGTFAGEAIQHALAAADYALAVDLLESHATDMIMQGYAKTVDGWVQAIPQEWRSSSSKTHLAFAWMHALRGNYPQAFSYLEQLQAIFQAGEREAPSVHSADPRSDKAEWLALQSLMLNMQGKATESETLLDQALEIAPQEDDRVRSLIYMGLAGAYQLGQDYPRAMEAYQKSIQHGRASANSVAEMMSVAGLASMALEHGQLHLAFEIASPVSARVERSGSPPPISTVVHGVLGQVHYQWHQLEQARDHVLRALQLSALGGYNTGAIYYRVLLSRLLQIEGDLETAAQEIQQAVELMQVGTPPDVQEEVISQQVRVYLAQDRLAAANMALQGQGFSFQGAFSFPALPPNRNFTHSLGLLYNSALRVLLHQAQARPVSLEPGIALAERLIASALQGQYLLVALETLLLRAQLHAAQGNNAASLADYVRALELAEPEGFIGVFVEQGAPVAETLVHLVKQDQLGAVQPAYVERILAAFSDSKLPDQPAPSPPVGTGPSALVEPLTERELEVLRLMVEGLKYKEIAARLFISLNTVRSHVRAIYGKLDANNRTKAIEMARQLQIL
ncbi:MAG: LuxR C-terminal-related transcriptional regulator [Anaerolineae bacterium]|jgi:LuxR family maltose regulon positive regulatory protein